jgi:hypothetical protein
VVSSLVYHLISKSKENHLTMKNIIYLVVFTFILISCEEKMVVIPQIEIIETGKVVYVEDLTGVKCPNCPAASERLKSIHANYPNNMVVVGIHGINNASPLPESKYDFRVQDAVDLEIFLRDFLGKPSAYFNRVKFEELTAENIWGNPFIGTWEGYVEGELSKPQVMNVTITKTFDEETRELDIVVGVLPFEDMTGEFKLTVLLTESDIEDAQEDQITIIEDYIHDHVLMDVITKYDGDAFGSSFEKNVVQTRNYKYTIPTELEGLEGLLRPEHLEVIAFIANTDGESEEVLQAASVHLLD